MVVLQPTLIVGAEVHQWIARFGAENWGDPWTGGCVITRDPAESVHIEALTDLRDPIIMSRGLFRQLKAAGVTVVRWERIENGVVREISRRI